MIVRTLTNGVLRAIGDDTHFLKVKPHSTISALLFFGLLLQIFGDQDNGSYPNLRFGLI